MDRTPVHNTPKPPYRNDRPREQTEYRTRGETLRHQRYYRPRRPSNNTPYNTCRRPPHWERTPQQEWKKPQYWKNNRRPHNNWNRHNHEPRDTRGPPYEPYRQYMMSPAPAYHNRPNQGPRDTRGAPYEPYRQSERRPVLTYQNGHRDRRDLPQESYRQYDRSPIPTYNYYAPLRDHYEEGRHDRHQYESYTESKTQNRDDQKKQEKKKSIKKRECRVGKGKQVKKRIVGEGIFNPTF